MTAHPQKRILLGHLAARGDCLYATAIARQIKADYPGCHLTWAISSMCREILDNNPHVDEVWTVPAANHDEVAAAWKTFYPEAQERLRRGEFDEAFFTQIYPANFRHYDCTIRASIFRAYPRPIAVPIAPVVCLRADEIEHVRQFAERHHLNKNGPAILFEFSAASGQGFVDADFACKAALEIVTRLPGSTVVMTSQRTLESADPRIVSGHTLSFRENAELTKYCSLLIGCSSGITWLCTSEAARPLPTIQLLARNKGVFASVAHDHAYFGLPTDHIIEMTNCPVEDFVDCVVGTFTDGFAGAKKRYHVRLQPDFTFYLPTLRFYIRKGYYRDMLQSNWHILRRYGPRGVVLALNLRTLKYIFQQVVANAATRVGRWFGGAGRRDQ